MKITKKIIDLCEAVTELEQPVVSCFDIISTFSYTIFCTVIFVAVRFIAHCFAFAVQQHSFHWRSPAAVVHICPRLYLNHTVSVQGFSGNIFAKVGEGMVQSSNGEFFVTCRQSGGNEQKLLILKNAADSGKNYTISVTLYRYEVTPPSALKKQTSRRQTYKFSARSPVPPAVEERVVNGRPVYGYYYKGRRISAKSYRRKKNSWNKSYVSSFCCKPAQMSYCPLLSAEHIPGDTY